MTLRSSRRKLKTKTAATNQPTQTHRIVQGTIASNSSGVWSVTVGADTIIASHYAHYSPTIGDLVEVLLVDGSPRILGQLVGQPTF